MRKPTRFLIGTSAAMLFGTLVPLSMANDAPQDRAVGVTSASDVPADPAVRRGTLPNGMRYAIMHNQSPPRSASLRLRIDAGSLHERDDQRGVAHFLEHMVFNGTTNVPEGEFVRRLERHGLRFGADTNASTGFNQTIYKLELPVASDAVVDEALFLFREVADEATLAADAIDRERNIILSEERARATPRFRMFTDELAFLFAGQRLNDRMPIGLVETIKSAPRERFVEFYNAYYRPERATLIMVGDFDVDAMEAKIRARFGSWRGEGEAGGEPDLGAVARREATARVHVEPGGADRVALSWTRPYDDSADTRAERIRSVREAIAVQVLNRRLARIASSEGTPPFISASLTRATPGRSGEVIQIAASVRPSEWQGAVTAIEQEWRRLIEHGVTEGEVEMAVAGMRTAWDSAVAGAGTRLSNQLSDRLVDAVDSNRVFAAPATGRDIFLAAIDGLTVADVHAAARGLTQGAGEPLLYRSTPGPDTGGGDATLLAAWRASGATPVTAPEARAMVAWPYESFGTPGRVVERREIGDGIGATLVRFANGVRLTIKPTDFTDNQIQVIVSAGEGRAHFPEGTPSPAWAMSRGGFISGGLGKIGFEDMREALTGRNVGARALLLDDAVQLSGNARPEDFATQMQLIAAYLSDPRWDPSAWNRIRSLASARHNEFEATPGGIYERDAAQLLHAGDRRWGMPTQAEMESSSIDDLRALIEKPLAEGPVEVLIIGDVTVDEAIAQTAATFGALPQRRSARKVAPPQFPAPTAEPVRLTHSGRADQGLAMITWPTMGSLADLPTSRALSVLTAIYRLRLTDKVREEQGATYSPAVGQATSSSFDTFGFLYGRIEAPPALLDRFLVDAAAIAKDLTQTPVTADELERARKPMLESLRRSRASNNFWRFTLGGIHEDPRVATAITTQEADLQRITPEILQEVARRFLRPDTAWKLVIAPTSEAHSPTS